MSVGEKQELFSKMFARLILYCESLGYGVRLKHVLRCEDCKVGHKSSLHKLSLAGDIVLTLDGRILVDTNEYIFAGEYWEDMHDSASWGGTFGDGGHFSIKHNGMR